MDKINSIMHYDSAYSVLDAYFDIQPDKDGLTEEEIDILKGFDAFDGMEYTVINDETVIVSETGSGNVIETLAMDEFLVSTMAYIHTELM